MGTRSLIKVISPSGEGKIIQYGQWDGYPEGVGAGLLGLLKTPGFLSKLTESLPKIRFLEPKGKDKAFWEDYEQRCPEWSNEPDNRTEEQCRWWATFCHRNLSEEVLQNIVDSKDAEIVLLKGDWEDFDWIEWRYIVDLKSRTFTVESLNSYSESFDECGQFSLDELPSLDNFRQALEGSPEEEGDDVMVVTQHPQVFSSESARSHLKSIYGIDVLQLDRQVQSSLAGACHHAIVLMKFGDGCSRQSYDPHQAWGCTGAIAVYPLPTQLGSVRLDTLNPATMANLIHALYWALHGLVLPTPSIQEAAQ